MPHVCDLEAGDERERLRPVGARVAGDRSFGVALRAPLQITGRGWTATVQAGAIPPLGIELDAIGGVGHHQERLALAEQPRHRVRAGGVTAQHAVLITILAAEPEIAGTRYR